MEVALKISSILGDAGQFVFGLVALILSIYALSKKRRDIFQSELAKSQFVEIGRIRDVLSQIFYDIYYVSEIKGQLEATGWSLEDYRQKCPEEWNQYARYKSNSLDLFYKFLSPNYYLLPEWVDPKVLSVLTQNMRDFAPFTVLATGSKSHEKLAEYQNSMLALIDHFDKELRKNA